MNKLIIGLLVVAAGGAIFLLLRKKKNATVTNEIKKEWIVGKWETAAVIANDSNFSKYSFDFQKDGQIVRSLNDSVKADTAHYEWSKANELVWKEKLTDSAGRIYQVIKLTADSLQVQAVDSSTVLFTKLK
ncbi:MAG: hypothetical protein ABI688_08765 [Bacteroidota bacterium]